MTTNKPTDGEALPRYGVRWNGEKQPITVPMVDGYWTPWHLAQSECEKLRKDVDQYRRLIELGEDFQWENIIRVDISDFPSRADAIDAIMGEK